MENVRIVKARLSESTGWAYIKCLTPALRPVSDLERGVQQYMDELQVRAQTSEFLDLATASKAANGCKILLSSLKADPSLQRHRAVQGAVDYFILEEDAEADDSIIGFDDDWEVVETTAAVLGVSLKEPGE